MDALDPRSDLRLERARLEADVERLRAELQQTEKRIWQASVRRSRTRGLGWGLLVGGLFVAIVVGSALYQIASFMSHMG
jgi:hypothetical protein